MDITYKGETLHVTTNYRKSGQELLVFLPGLSCPKEAFADAWDTDTLQNYSLLSVDYVGHGDSSKSQNFSYTMEDHAAIVNLLLSHMKEPTVHIVAHSMGGAIGLLSAETLDSRLKSFVNVEGNLLGEDCGVLSRKTISVPFETFKSTLFGELQEMMASSEEKGARLWATWSNKTDPYAFYKSAESLVAWSDSGDLMKKFQSLPVEKTYIYGEKNVPDLIKQLQQIHPIPSFEVANSGHFVMNDNPQDFYRILSEVLQ